MTAEPISPLKVTSSYQISPALMQRLEQAARYESTSKNQIIQAALIQYFERVDRKAWGTIDGDDVYDPTRFYTHGQDHHGHGHEMRFTIPKSMAGIVSRVVQGGYIPQYKTMTHFGRDAVIHRAYQLSQMIESGELQSQVNLAVLLAEEAQIQAEEAEAAAYVQAVKDNCEMYTLRRDWDRLEEYLADRAHYADVVPEGWREAFTEVLKTYRDRMRIERKG